MPSVIGSGRGDVEDVLSAGDVLARGGARVKIYRVESTRKPWLDDPSFGWERFPAIGTLSPNGPRALTVSSQFGVTAPEPRAEPLGGPGPWTEERRRIERRYGIEGTLHVSLEEFARTLPSRRQAEERHREGGRSSRERRRHRIEIGREAEQAHALFRKFRDLGRSNLLPLFPTFSPSQGFAREFPESVQCGPLWPTVPRATRRAGAEPGPSVIWYASPSSSTRLLPGVLRAIARGPRPGSLDIRSPSRFELPPSHGVRVRFVRPGRPRTWSRHWAAADLRIATGSRTLLEAITLGAPFLYFNGVLGRGSATRRHRPEKLDALLRVWRHRRVDPRVVRDLRDVARARRVTDVVGRALRDARWRRSFPRTLPVEGFAPGFESASLVLDHVAAAFGLPTQGASELVRQVRVASRAPSGRRSPRPPS